ncbi:putative RNA-directed DNA polymerase, eukaryota, reverse transcriptase zinc-binding domain protein [Tanacetum coccineum]
MGLYEQGDQIFVANDAQSVADKIDEIGIAQTNEDDEDSEHEVDAHIQDHDVRSTHEPLRLNKVHSDSDPFGLDALINKKSGKVTIITSSATPDFTPRFPPGEHHATDYLNNLSDGIPIKQPDFSMIDRLEETIKVGFGDVNKRRWVCDLCHLHNVNFLAIQETKMLHVDLWLLRHIWGNTNFDFACTSARVDGHWIPGDIQVRWIVVYAPQSLSNKFALWSSLSAMIANWDGAVLEKGIPDHRPILLKESEVDYGPTPFRFLHSCLEMEGFQNLVTHTWKNDGVDDLNGLISFKKKLQNLKKAIRTRVASKKLDTHKLKKEHQNHLSSIDATVDQGLAIEEDILNRKDSLSFLGDLDRMEAKDLAQKAKIEWALKGDENTSFFHGMLKKKSRQLAIKGILKNGEWIENPDHVKDAFLDHFRKHFQQTQGISPYIDTATLKPLSSCQQESLELPFSREEIKKAVWDCGGDRALGPDGFMFKFFTTFWDLLEVYVIHFVQEFFHSKTSPKAVIRKILANRLIKGRNILDGPLILNEVLAWYQKSKKELMVFKVDFEKAFDSLRWDDLDLVLDKLGFGYKWRSWIFSFLRNARSSVLINGSPTAEFELFRGLRQGDPLSPFLFILAMEGLHAFTSKAEEIGLFKGASFGRDSTSISHLMYADDVIFFGEWSWLNAQHLGCGAANLPPKYLGVPVGCNMSRCSNWNAIIKKFSLKLSSWKARLLSVGGRLSLIKSVLGNLPTYYMSIYLMPVSVRNKLESMRNKFFIGGDQKDKKMTWVN